MTSASFYLQDAEGRPLPPFKAGQHLTLDLPEGAGRDYTLSSFAPRPSAYRVTARLYGPEAGGRGGSVALHGHQEGDVLEAAGPSGAFVLPRDLRRPLVLVSSGIGITPMIAFAEELAWRAPRHPLWFVHGARNGATMAFARSLRALRNELPNARWHVRFSAPRAVDRPDVDFQSEGRVDIALLQSLLPFGGYDFYLCGPDAFLSTMTRGLRELDVPDERIRLESFAISGPEEGGADDAPDDEEPLPELLPRTVSFRGAGVTGLWEPEKGTLLDFAEAMGIAAPHSCRTGMCGACSQTLAAGSVHRVQETAFRPDPGRILLCSCVPLTDIEIEL